MAFLYSRREYRQLNSDIDVTPFVDVMLVLLIIFMITSPMLINGVEVNLPEAKAKSLSNEAQPITISIDKERNIYLEEDIVSHRDLVEKLTAIVSKKHDTKIFVRGDSQVDYGLVLSVFADIRESGFDNVGLVTTEVLSDTGYRKR